MKTSANLCGSASLIAVFYLFAGCHNTLPQSPGRIVITGTIASPKIGDLECYFSMDNAVPVFADTVSPTDLGRSFDFRFVLSTDSFLTGFIRYAGKNIYLFAEPGDSQHIAFDCSDFDNTLQLAGPGSPNSTAYSKYLNIYYRDCEAFDQSSSQMKTSWRTYRLFVDSAQARLRDTISNTTDRLEKSSAYQEYEKAEDHFLYLDRLARFWMQSADGDSCRPFLDSLLLRYPRFTRTGLATNAFVPFLAFYYCYTMDTAKLSFYRRVRPPTNSELDSILRRAFPPRFYAYWQVSQNATQLWLCPTPQSRSLYYSFIQEDIYPPYTAYMRRMYQRGVESQRLDSIAELRADLSRYVFLDAKGDTFTFTKHEGNVIYLDFWASWCVNCIYEIPNITKLHSKLRNEHFVFVGISVDNDSTKWLTALRKNKNPGYQICLPAGRNPILTNLNVNGLPKYVLIDKTGRIVDANAKRPSNPGLEADIKKLLL